MILWIMDQKWHYPFTKIWICILCHCRWYPSCNISMILSYPHTRKSVRLKLLHYYRHNIFVRMFWLICTIKKFWIKINTSIYRQKLKFVSFPKYRWYPWCVISRLLRYHHTTKSIRFKLLRYIKIKFSYVWYVRIDLILK